MLNEIDLIDVAALDRTPYLLDSPGVRGGRPRAGPGTDSNVGAVDGADRASRPEGARRQRQGRARLGR